MEDIINLVKNNPELRRELASYLADDILNEISEHIRKEIEEYASRDPAVTRRAALKAVLGAILLAGGVGSASALTNITDRRITIDGKEAVLVPSGASDGQIIVRQGNQWQIADPSVDKWAGEQLTPRDVTKDLKRLTEATLSSLKAFRVFTPENFKPVRTFNLYRKISSNSTDDEEIGVVSGSGSSSETVEYIRQGEIVWIESMGLKAEFSATPDVTWNPNKYITLKRRHYPYGSDTPIESEETYGGKASDIENWRHVVSLSEVVHYVDSFKKDAKAHLKCDFVALTNNHYWFVNEHGDEYIKLVADAGCFTYTDDVVAIYMKGMVFSVSDVLAEPTE